MLTQHRQLSPDPTTRVDQARNICLNLSFNFSLSQTCRKIRVCSADLRTSGREFEIEYLSISVYISSYIYTFENSFYNDDDRFGNRSHIWNGFPFFFSN